MMLNFLRAAGVRADDETGSEPLESEEAPAATLSGLYRRYAKPVYRYVYSRTGNRQDAEDVTEQVLMDVLKGLDRYEERGREAAWIFSIARRRVADFHRGRSDHLTFDESLDTPDGQPQPEMEVSRREQLAHFEPLAPSVERLTLKVDRLWFSAEPSSSFTVDLGADPEFGARWPLDINGDVGGFPVHINGVRLEEGAEDVPFKLVFETEVEHHDRRRLEGVNLGLARDVTDYGGAYHSATTHFSRAGKLEPTISLAALPAAPSQSSSMARRWLSTGRGR